MRLIFLYKFILVIILLMLFFIKPNVIAFATNQNIGSFSVRARIPENQFDKKQSYFDIVMKENSKQVLVVDVINNNKEPITVNVNINAASTNRNGTIEYQVETDPHCTLKLPFNKIAKLDKDKIELGSFAKKQVNILVSTPKEVFDGTILGAIIFTKEKSKQLESTQTIENLFSYVIGVKIHETDKKIEPDFKLTYIKPAVINYKNYITLDIENPKPLIIKNMNITAQIFKDGDKTPLYDFSKKKIDMAPNSVYSLPISLEKEILSNVNYKVIVKIFYNSNNWKLERLFNIKNNETKNINTDKNKITSFINSLDLIIILKTLIITLFLFLIYFIKLNKINYYN